MMPPLPAVAEQQAQDGVFVYRRACVQVLAVAESRSVLMCSQMNMMRRQLPVHGLCGGHVRKFIPNMSIAVLLLPQCGLCSHVGRWQPFKFV
jgi:hypothetical protein